MRHVVISSALAALALSLSATPSAAETLTERVSLEDLDLASDADRAILDQRIQSAVRKICSQRVAVWAFRMHPRSVCMRRVSETVAPQIAQLRQHRTNQLAVSFATRR